MLVINDKNFIERAEIIREKGTNRSSFFRGEVDKYGWVDIGSSFLPSDIIAAFLFAQIEQFEQIQNRRKAIWNFYNNEFQILESEFNIRLPFVPTYATNNAHMFYILCNSLTERTKIISALKEYDIMAVSHYLSLNDSEYFNIQNNGRNLIYSDCYSNKLLRFPFYFELNDVDIQKIVKITYAACKK